MLRYFTSGESHGEALVAFLSGLPAGLEVDQDFVDRDLCDDSKVTAVADA